MRASSIRAWIVGCGDIGCRLALRLRADGVDSTGFVRSEASLARLQRLDINARQIDLDTPLPMSLPAIPDWLFYCAPPPPQGSEDSRLRRLLASLPKPPARLVYLSTSGVYGDCGGRWIDEDEPLKPAHLRAHRRVDAERAVTDYLSRHHITAVILRVAGIYGPGRLRVDRLRARDALVLPAQSPWSNRVHADDLAEAMRLAAQKAEIPRNLRHYNIADGYPLTMTDYLQRCAALLKLPPPPLRPLVDVLAAASPMRREFLSESRRLRNQRACGELDWQPRALEAGLASSLLPDRMVAAASVIGYTADSSRGG